MKSILSLLFTFLFSSLFAQNQDIDPNDLHNLFWKIEHPYSKKVGYLIGTIHLIDKDKFVLPKEVTKRISKADVLYVEIAEMQGQAKAMELSMMKEGRMTDILSKEQRDSVYVYTNTEFGMDSAKFEKLMGKFKPLVFSQLAFAKLLTSAKSYDLTISALAKENKIPVEGFETLEEQMGFFDSMSDELKIELIMQTVRKNDSNEEEWEKMQNLYLDQNLPELLKVGEFKGEMSDFMNTTISENRNVKWVSKLDKEFDKNNLFIAVGAAHLQGDRGLINLLLSKGYVLTPISIQLK
ncbi:TraB/GumN family protein [Crocinitomicaceae bacterium]|nr:TraB/GumN family protein [Crocinitomicaceae bacterium]